MNNLLDQLLADERARLDAWLHTDTAAYVAGWDEDSTYFDTYAPARIDGAAPLRAHMSGIGAAMRAMLEARGKAKLDRYEVLRPRVQAGSDMAVLTYDWVGYLDQAAQGWRATVVFRRDGDSWRRIHAHWSVVQPTSS